MTKNYSFPRLINRFKFSFLPSIPGLPTHFMQPLTILMTTLAVSQSVFAESLEGYCISKAEQTEREKKPQVTLLEDKPPSALTVSRNGQVFTIVVDDIDRRTLLLKLEGETEAIDQMTLPPEGGNIINLILGQDDWLWIDGNVTDYIIELSFKKKVAQFNSPKELPELYSQPCNAIKRFLNRCKGNINSNYSTTLSRVFVSGYRRKSWGKKNYIHLEVISGEETPVPELLAKASFVADIPQWNGVLFQKPNGEALFYDGVIVTNLSEDFLQLEGGENFQGWDIQKTLGGRTFLGKFVNRQQDDPLFLMELKAKPGLKPIYLPQEGSNKWFKVMTMPNDSQSTLWIMTRNKISAKIQQKIQTVARIPPLSFIKRYTSIKHSVDGAISFRVYRDNNESFTSYFLQQSSPTANCQNMSDFENSVLLEHKK